jgi:hypothetical protein
MIRHIDLSAVTNYVASTWCDVATDKGSSEDGEAARAESRYQNGADWTGECQTSLADAEE